MNIPTTWIVIGVLGLGVLGTGWLLKESYKANGVLKVAIEQRDAVIEQNNKDRALNTDIITDLRQKTTEAGNTAAPIRERIIHVPATTVDDPAITIAVDGLRQLFADPGTASPGR